MAGSGGLNAGHKWNFLTIKKTLTFLSGSTIVGAPTFSDAPTFSGNPVFSGTPVFSGDVTLTGAPNFTGDPTITGNLIVTGNALFDRKITNVTTATLAPALTDKGTLYTFNKADGIAVTLPAITAGGAWFDFVFATSAAGGNTTITAGAADLLIGGVTAIDTDTANAVVWDDPDGTDDLIMTFNGGTTGGLVGTYVRFYAISATRWLVSGFNRHSGNFATAFS